jgi:hypothetical protein
LLATKPNLGPLLFCGLVFPALIRLQRRARHKTPPASSIAKQWVTFQSLKSYSVMFGNKSRLFLNYAQDCSQAFSSVKRILLSFVCVQKNKPNRLGPPPSAPECGWLAQDSLLHWLRTVPLSQKLLASPTLLYPPALDGQPIRAFPS